MAQKTIVIKKYENRRLYDTTNSRYVNLEEVAQLLQQGNDVQVLDASTGEDITRLILTQIIVEDAKTPESSFPLDLLRQMVIASGRASQESALQYMKAMLDIYQNAYQAMPNPLNPFEFMQNLRTKAEKKPEAGMRYPDAAEPAEREKTSAKQAPESESVEELKSRLADLERMVTKLASPKAKRRQK